MGEKKYNLSASQKDIFETWAKDYGLTYDLLIKKCKNLFNQNGFCQFHSVDLKFKIFSIIFDLKVTNQ